MQILEKVLNICGRGEQHFPFSFFLFWKKKVKNLLWWETEEELAYMKPLDPAGERVGSLRERPSAALGAKTYSHLFCFATAGRKEKWDCVGQKKKTIVYSENFCRDSFWLDSRTTFVD